MRDLNSNFLDMDIVRRYERTNRNMDVAPDHIDSVLYLKAEHRLSIIHILSLVRNEHVST